MSAASVTGVDELLSASDLGIADSEIPNSPVVSSDGAPFLAPAAVRHLRPKNPSFMNLGHAWRASALDAFDHVGSGAILIDDRGRVIKINNEARRHLGAGICINRGCLAATDRSSNPALQELVKGMSAPRSALGRGAALARRGAQPLLAYSVQIGRRQEEFGAASGILLLVDPQSYREPPQLLLRQLFGLTPAEARLAAGLAKGLDLQEISEFYAVSVGTLRVQLKSIFAKTQTKRQAQLVVLLARLSL